MTIIHKVFPFKSEKNHCDKVSIFCIGTSGIKDFVFTVTSDFF